MGVSSGGSVSPSISLAIWFHRAAKLVIFFLRFGSAISEANWVQWRARMRHSFGSPGMKSPCEFLAPLRQGLSLTR